MESDYRNTKYCASLSGIADRKQEVVKQVLADHPKAEDMHNYIRENEDKYKNLFIQAYNGKCAYCGVSISEIPKTHFEVDHYIHEKASCFKTKKDAGKIENLILACHDCNHNKCSFLISDESYNKLYPDGNDITKTFIRDDNYYIRVSPSFGDDKEVNDFYNKLKLGSEIRRLDYLLMNIKGLKTTISDATIKGIISDIIEILQQKRNLGVTS